MIIVILILILIFFVIFSSDKQDKRAKQLEALGIQESDIGTDIIEGLPKVCLITMLRDFALNHQRGNAKVEPRPKNKRPLLI